MTKTGNSDALFGEKCLTKNTFIKNTISVVADDLGEAGYHHSTSTKKERVRGGYVMPPEASSIDTLLSRSKALADQMREEVDD